MASMTNKLKATQELRNLTDSLEESILNASDAEVSEELSEAGIDPMKAASEMDAFLQEAKLKAGKKRLADAKQASALFRAGHANALPSNKSKLRAKLQDMRNASGRGNADGMMMAARKGKAISPDDEEGTLDDLAQLEALESDDPPVSE
jgi:hypothetical protein